MTIDAIGDVHRCPKKPSEGAGMTIDWDQFNEGDEVAVTIVGKWSYKWDTSGALQSSDGRSFSSDYSLKSAVDACRIEPDYEPGDMVRSPAGAIWQMDHEKYWRLITASNGEPGSINLNAVHCPAGSTRVKVVDA